MELIELPKRQKRRIMYEDIMEHLFWRLYVPGATEVEFTSADLRHSCEAVDPAANPPDVIYSYRHVRRVFSEAIQACAQGYEWVIEGRGKGRYCFCIVRQNAFHPDLTLTAMELPNRSAKQSQLLSQDDEQAALTVVRDHRLLEGFLEAWLRHHQSHWRTYVDGVGQIETDDLYTGFEWNDGRQIIIPVQAKGKSMPINSVQVRQDILAHPRHNVRPVGIVVVDDVYALMEFGIDPNNDVYLKKEKHYRLV